MPWVYLDDAFYDHPKIEAATGQDDVAGWMWTVGLGWTNRNLTNGLVPKTVVGRLTHHRNPAKLATILVDVGLWIPQGDHFEYKDYERWNSSAARSAQGKKAAKTRWKPNTKPPPNHARAHAEALPEHMPEHMPEQCSSNGNGDAPAHAGAMLGHMPHARRVPTTPSTSKSSSSSKVLPGAGLEEEAIRILAEKRLTATPATVNNRAAYLKTVEASLVHDHADRLADLPDGLATAQAVADWLEPPTTAPGVQTQAAAQALAARNQLPDCADCDSTGWAGGNPEQGRCQTCRRLL